MLRIRPNAFETNSSSCHSIVFSEDNGATLDYLVIEETGDLKLPHPDGETRFGWDIADYNDAPTKLNYLYVYLEKYMKSSEDQSGDPEFYRNGTRNLYHVLKEKTLCDHIVLVPEDESRTPCYIDHASLEGGKNEQDIREILSSPEGVRQLPRKILTYTDIL